MKRHLLTSVLLLLPLLALAGRTDTILVDGWKFYPAYNVLHNPEKTDVTIPHSWNLEDVYSGLKYDRSSYIYEYHFERSASMEGKRVFLRFEAVSSVADVFVNQKWVGDHKGGYTAFCFEITDFLVEGDNKIAVIASNAFRTDVAPLAGDFNIYGGITRPVHLIVAEQDCISPLDHASSGVYVHQDRISHERAEFTVETVLSLKGNASSERLRVKVLDADGNEVASSEGEVSDRVRMPFAIDSPVLWDGRRNPCQYTVRAELLRNGEVIDCQEVRTGFRYFSVDARKGFFLNGELLDLHGVCRHEESYKCGHLYNEAAMEQDADIMMEIGATMTRLAHYPHSRYDVEAYDKRGIVVWYELPFAGPGGYLLPGYVPSPEFERNLMVNLDEMVWQNYNSPSICFWSIFNELSHKYDDPDGFVKRLNARLKELDPGRLTAMALCYDQPQFQGISDLLAWNKYFMWYDSQAGGLGEFMDASIREANGQPVGVSEYGAAGSVNQHGLENVRTNRIHLEEYQAKAHEDNYAAIANRPDIWCKLVWHFSDFSSSIRDEGDSMGMNDKGLLTYDRKIRKDAFYFYKANWSDEPTLYISARRYVDRTDAEVPVKVYTNQKDVTLYVNGKRIGKAKADALHRAEFPSVTLREGENLIEVRSGKLVDSCTWNYKKEPARTLEVEAGRLDGSL